MRSPSRSRSPRSFSRSRSHSPVGKPRGGGGGGYDRGGDRGGPTRYDDRRRGGYRGDERRGGGGDRGGDRRRDDGQSSREKNQAQRDDTPPSTRLGIFGMNLSTSERDMRKVFEKYGRIHSVTLVTDHYTGRSRGFGFVSFDNQDDATKARDRVHDTVIDGMKVFVNYAFRRESNGGGGGGSSSRRRSRSPIRSSRRDRSPSY